METYESVKQCVEAKGIPRKILLAAKEQKAPGFRGSRIYWDEFGPWYEQNKGQLQEAAEESFQKYRTETEKWKSKAAKLDYEKASNSSLDKEEVKQLLFAISTVQNSILIDKLLNELNPKLDGKTFQEREPILKQVIYEISEQFNRTTIEKWLGGR